MLTILLRALRVVLALSGDGQKTASFKWLALRADGPGELPENCCTYVRMYVLAHSDVACRRLSEGSQKPGTAYPALFSPA